MFRLLFLYAWWNWVAIYHGSCQTWYSFDSAWKMFHLFHEIENNMIFNLVKKSAFWSFQVVVLVLYQESYKHSGEQYDFQLLWWFSLSYIKNLINLTSTWLKVIVHLVRSLDSMSAPAARAMVIWMLGEYCNIGFLTSKMIPTIFKYLAQRFHSESVETKLQIVNACVKVVISTQ